LRNEETYPVCLMLANRRCLVAGGGAVAQRKIRMLLKSGAAVTCLADRATPFIRKLARSRKISLVRRRILRTADVRSFLKGMTLVIAATSSREINRMISRECLRRNLLINVVDDLELSNFIVPAVVRRGALNLAVSTGGRSPELAKRIREKLEKIFGREYRAFLEFMAEERGKILSRVLAPGKRKKVFRAIARSKLLKYFKAKEPGKAAAHYRRILSEQGVLGCFEKNPRS